MRVEEDFHGFDARIFQHELDHLDGIIYIDRVESSMVRVQCVIVSMRCVLTLSFN
jgi:peptide deformylase